MMAAITAQQPATARSPYVSRTVQIDALQKAAMSSPQEEKGFTHIGDSCRWLRQAA
jgi:hypothetical protein